MQTLTDAKLIMQGRDAYMLQYLLQKQGMLSTTGYKVLQGQENAGLIPCYRVVYDTADKLDYDVEQYQDLESLLPELAPEYFLNYVKSILAIILNMPSIGFLHPCNLETTLDKIFIDRTDHSVHMIYLPISESFMNYMNKQYEQTLKADLGMAVQKNKNLQSNDVKPVFELMCNASATLEHIYAALQGVAPLPQQAAVTPTTGSLNQTGGLGTSSSLSNGDLTSGSLNQPVSETELAADEPDAPPEAAAMQGKNGKKQKPPKKKLFGRREQAPPSGDLIQEVGGTEVLELFVPTIYLKGPDKMEFLVDKREYVLGRDNEAHGTIDSTAVSRRHCVITHSDGRNFATDLGSANGTYLNGNKLEPNKVRPINEGDKLKLGNLSFTIMNV